ncbi:alanine racemase [Pokkaliibacter plantistimulans]|uniref:Alanine racemase n=1 Tax=Proteobacteria bacterium 228 TaxID=2083153 RepID=A0A2S5KPK8_9PROT|nr:D-TA family PLP-dependent enzyme [Pokkaliibacter plantistimulans]PPC76469.1 alanine racemase [Pokkaliibacter plantistimulans]
MNQFTDLDTPCVVIDEDRVERNIQRFQAFCQQQRVQLRPHIKTHKLPYIAQKQLAAGASGITCQKIGEAEVFADAGFDDILLTFNIVGAPKLQRLLALARRIRLTVVADSQTVVEGLARTVADTDVELGVMVECDTGAGRCGVQTPAQALQLAEMIQASRGLTFRGLMTYPKAFSEPKVEAWYRAAQGLFNQHDLPVPCFSSGGTPSMWHLAQAPMVTEYRIGTYVYQDRSQISAGACTAEDCALHVLATVVSVPVAGRVIIDAGSKALTSDLLGLDGYGQVVGYPQARVVGLSEEHGTLDTTACVQQPQIGDQLLLLPNHACPVSNLFDEVYFYRRDGQGEARVERCERVAARGKVA